MNRLIKISSSAIYLLGLFLLGCLDPYQPPTSNEKTDFLVIDGHINSTDNIATVKLSRAIGLSEPTRFPPEPGATVSIEGEDNQITPVPEVSGGVYSANHIFDKAIRYRLKITTQDKEYLSEFINLESNTPIDSINWKADGKKLTIFGNTHDIAGGIKYYRYTYDETFEYTSTLFSSYRLVNGEPVFRTPEEIIYWCWTTRPSNPILLTSTENLTTNIVAGFPILSIEKGDRRLWKKYSILLRQISLGKEAYTYWTQIKKTTESLGGLFDPLPYQIKGNVSSAVNPNETVLGYFSAGEVTEKRIVISNRQLPSGYSGRLQNDCLERNVKLNQLSTLDSASDIITSAEYMGPFVIGYFYSSPGCTDCRLQGGTNVRPDFMN